MRQVAGRHAQLQLKILPQHFDQRRIEARLIFMRVQRETRAGAFALQRDRQQDQRRLDAHLRFVGPRPHQKAQCDEQRIGAAFLQRIARAPVQIDQPHVQLRLGQPDKHLFALQGFGGVGGLQIFQAACFVQWLAARVLPVHQLARRQQLDGLALGQSIFQRRRGHFQQQRFFARLEVQQHIAQRQIEQLALPARQPVFRVQLSGGDVFQALGAGQLGRVFDGAGGPRPFRRQQRIGPGLGQRQRFDARHACAADVHHALKFTVLFFRQLAYCLGNRLAETHRLALRHQRGFKHQQLLQLQALAHGGDIVHHGAGKFLIAQPHPGKRMALGKDQ